MTRPLMKPHVRNNVLELERKIRDTLLSNPSFSNDLINEQICEIEKKIGIVPKPPQIYHQWEKANKEGWQYGNFVSEREYKRREKVILNELDSRVR